jgi:hypothetical protein
MSELGHRLFRLSANKDAQLLLALVVCLSELQAGRHPSLGPVVGVSAWDLETYVIGHRETGAIHPSVDAELILSDNVRSMLSRLKRLGHVRNGPVGFGEPSVWRPSDAGLQFLAERILFKPEPGERPRRAA